MLNSFMSEIILTLSVLSMSITIVWLLIQNNNRHKKIQDIELKNVLIDIELKKRKASDEINNLPIDDLIHKRNSSDDNNK